MEWTAKSVTRLYELYLEHIDRLRNDVIDTNRSLGSPHPEKTKLEPMPRSEFERFLHRLENDPESGRLWLRRIIRDHEQEFPELESAGTLRRTGT